MASQSRLKTYLMLTGGMILFGSATPVSKLISEQIPVYLASFIRVFVSALVLVPFVWPRRGAVKSLTQKQSAIRVAISLVGTFLIYGYHAYLYPFVLLSVTG